MTPIFGRIQEIIDEGRQAALATIVEASGSTPGKPGARMIVHPDASIEGTIGGGTVEKQTIEKALDVIQSGENRSFQFDLRDETSGSAVGVCGGTLRVFIEKIGRSSRLIVFGGGHVGQTLAWMAEGLDLDIVIYDDRREFTDPARFPARVKTVCDSFDRAMDILKPTENDYIAIMSYMHTHDGQILHAALQHPFKYAGMIGSQKKCRHVMAELRDQGISQDLLDRVHAPIGIPIGAHTPTEIAISILAEIIRVMNGIE